MDIGDTVRVKDYEYLLKNHNNIGSFYLEKFAGNTYKIIKKYHTGSVSLKGDEMLFWWKPKQLILIKQIWI